MLEIEQKKRLIEHMGGRWWLPQKPLVAFPLGLSWQDMTFEASVKANAPQLKEASQLKEVLQLKEVPQLKEISIFNVPNLKEATKLKEPVNLKEPVKLTESTSQRHAAANASERIEFHLYLHRVGRMLFVLEHDQWEVAQLAQKESNLLLDIKQAIRLLLKADASFFEDATEQVMHFDWPRVTHAKISMTQQDAFSAVEGLIHSITHKDNIKLLLFFGQKSASYVHPLHQRVADFDVYLSSESIPMAFLPSLSTLLDAVMLKKELWTCLKKLVKTL